MTSNAYNEYLNNPNMVINDSDKNKLADLFNEIKDRVYVDEAILDARSSMQEFNQYIFNEKNNIHHVDLCDALDTGEDTIAVIPRNSGKSTVASNRYPAFRLGCDRGVREILASHTAGLAQSFSRSIESIFRIDRFKLLFGDLIPAQTVSNSIKWNETEKIVRDRPEINKLGFRVDAKDASIFAVGVGGAVVGRRADLIVLDDIIDRDSVKTEAQLEDTKYWFNEELKGTRHPKTQVVVVGSRWSTKDIYVHVMSTMLDKGATIKGNMVEEVIGQITRLRELEQEVNIQ